MKIGNNHKLNINKLKYRQEIIDPCFHLEERVRKKLIKRYDKPIWYYNVKMINDIIYNEKTHYVELFKEFLIYEDLNEFLKRYYKLNEINKKLPKILIFYEKYSRIYANYTVIPEAKYMYKNIKKKQKMIDQLQNENVECENEDENEEHKEDQKLSNTIFDSKALNSIDSLTMSLYDNLNNHNIDNSNIDQTNSKINESDNSVNNLLNQIEKTEKKMEKTKLKNKFANKTFILNNFKKNKKIKAKSNTLIGKSKNQLNNSIYNKAISAILNTNIHLKQSEKKNKNIKNRNLNSHINYTSKTKSNVNENLLIKPEKVISTFTSISPKIFHKKLFSSPTLSKKNIIVKQINNYKRASKLKKLFSNPSTYKPITQRESNSKILKQFNNKIKNNKSISKNKENQSVINNYNIINNFQEGSTQINIFTGNDLINSLNLQNNSIFNNSNFNSKSSSNKKNNYNNITYINSQRRFIKFKKEKFNLNLRTLIHKQIIEHDISTERNQKKNNFFDKLGKYFQNSKRNCKKDCNSMSKFSTNESNLISKIINNFPHYRKRNNKSIKEKNINLTNHNCSLLNSKCQFKIKKTGKNNNTNVKEKYNLKNLNDLNHYFKKSGITFGFNSERSKKVKTNIK